MTKEDQYDVLVEMMTGARLLAAFTESSEVVNNMENIKTGLVDAVIDLGYTETNINSDSITKYKAIVNG